MNALQQGWLQFGGADGCENDPGFREVVDVLAQRGVIREGLAKARGHLRPGGHLFVVNPFRTREVDVHEAQHILPDNLDAAEDAGFVLVEEKDVAEDVLPTLSLARHIEDDTWSQRQRSCTTRRRAHVQ